MKLDEKIEFYQDNHLSEWLKTRSKVVDDFSETQMIFCLCGKLATVLHESCCRKFQQRVNEITVQRLEQTINPMSLQGATP